MEKAKKILIQGERVIYTNGSKGLEVVSRGEVVGVDEGVVEEDNL